MSPYNLYLPICLAGITFVTFGVSCGKDDVGETGDAEIEYVSLSLGDSHMCLLRSDGLVECTGDGFLGETNTPSTEFVEIDGGLHHSCGVTADSQVECWGFDGFQHLEPTLSPLTGVSAGGYHTCAIGEESQVECWGGIRDGETDPQTGEFLSVSGGEGHTCALNVSGEALCWGLDDNEQASPPEGIFTSISSGWTHSCGIQNGGEVTCWGTDFDGETVAPDGYFTEVRAGKHFSCGLLETGELTCWGKDADGQASPPKGKYVTLDVGGDFACALDVLGEPHCWGIVPEDVAPQVVLEEGFSVQGITWNFGDYNWAEAGLCMSIAEPDAVLLGGEPVIKGVSTIQTAGAFSVSGVTSQSVLGLYMVAHDCDGVGDVVPTATGIPPFEYEDLVDGDALNSRLALVIDREFAGLMDDELGEDHSVETIGGMFGLVKNANGQYIDGATIICESDECPDIYYFDSDHSDGMFSTNGMLNTSTDASAESAFISPAAPIQNYLAEADGLNFRAEYFGSSPGMITMILFVGN